MGMPILLASPIFNCSSSCRPAVILPGLGNNSADYHPLELCLRERGFPSVVAKVSRLDWLRNAAGLLDPSYWRGTLHPRPVLDWYLNRVDDAVRQAKELSHGDGHGGTSVSLIAHSAGGWLARVYMEEYGHSHISLLLTLGTPHLPPPKGVPGVIDQTRGLLNYVQQHCSKPLYTPQLKYVCIAGRYIRGVRFFDSTNEDVDSVVSIDDKEQIPDVAIASTWQARFVGQGYKQVCGRADVWGDGVVPQVSAHLEGALNISLKGVYHSPVGSDDLLRPWYGSPAIVEQWMHHLLN